MIVKKLVCLILCVLLLHTSVWAANPVPKFDILSKNAVVMEAETGQVLFDQGMNEQKYPASITKVMTALIALEHCELTDVITVSDYAVEQTLGTSSIGLAAGDVLTVEDALHGMMLESANDCAIVIAEDVAGSEKDFVKLMNEKAKELGATNTNFVNSHGLHDEKHYTTAYDMALITREAMKNPDFVKIAGAKTYTMSDNPDRVRSNKNLMLQSGPYYYEYARFGKNGFTTPAQNTMVVEAKRGTLELICVVMNCTDGEKKYEDAANLLDFCYENFYKTKIDNDLIDPPAGKLWGTFGKIGRVDFQLDGEAFVMLPNGVGAEELSFSYELAPRYKRAEEYTASVTVSSDGAELFQIPMTGTAKKTITFYNILKTIFWLIIAAIVFIIGVAVYYIIEAERKKKQRRKAKFRRTFRVKKDL
ncbi:MAG: D-alanyl-D-alanine carboxypeptidase [Ruminococcaceae bacterium]|nr:D-alanyl-D-alanine carboxypeptidase [Oscillospiraceae bacterium]